jgi:hypothetical protein
MKPEKDKPHFGIRKKIKELLNTFNLIGLALGGIGGFIFYINTDTTVTGSFPITSSPISSVIWGALIGFLLADILYQSFKKRHK